MTELDNPPETVQRPDANVPAEPTSFGYEPGPPGPRARGQVHYTSAFWRRLAYWGARYGPRPLLRYSPPVLGTFFAAALRDQREIVRQNMRRALGVRSRWAEYTDVVRTFANYASCFAEALGAERADTKALVRRVAGAENLTAALEGRGALLATAHLGAWDVAARWLPELACGREVIVVMTSEADAEARRLNDAVRERVGVRIVHPDQHPLNGLGLLGDLRRGSIVCVQLDRVPDGVRAVPVQLFDGPFQVPQGPFTLAALARVALLPLFIARVGFLQYDVSIGQPIDVPRRPTQTDLVRAAQRATDEMERFIRTYPTQWFHFHGKQPTRARP